MNGKLKDFFKKRRRSAESKSPKSNKGKCDLAAAFSDSQRSAAGNEIQPKMGTNSAWQMEWLVRSSTHNRYWQGCQNWHRFNDEHAKQKNGWTWYQLSSVLRVFWFIIHLSRTPDYSVAGTMCCCSQVTSRQTTFWSEDTPSCSDNKLFIKDIFKTQHALPAIFLELV